MRLYFRDCSLSRQLILPMLLVGIIGVSATIYSALNLEGSVAALGEMYSAGDNQLKTLEELDKSIAHFRALTLRHLANEKATQANEIAGEIERSRRRILELIGATARAPEALRGEKLEQNERLTAEVMNYFEKIFSALELSADFEKESAFVIFTTAEGAHLPEIKDSIQRLMRLEFEEIAATREALMLAATRNLQITMALGIGGGGLLLTIAFVVTRRIIKRLSTLLEWSQDVAAGDISAPLHSAETGDEVGRLTQAMTVMATNISEAHRELDDARKRAEDAADTLRIYAQAFENSGEAILITDAENHIINVNNAFTEQTGYTLEEVKGKDPKVLGSGNTSPAIFHEMWEHLRDEGFWQGELWDRKKSGQIYPKWAAISAIRDEADQAAFYVASFTDISERKEAEERIAHLAHHDILTGLLNRFSLEDRLEQVLATARRERQQAAVLFIDLDRFKNINDSLGHQVGDQLLVEVANRLRGCVRESDVVARIGGDEFVIVLADVKDGTDIAHIADKMLREVSTPYTIADHPLETSPSIGIAVFPSDGITADELLKSADVAMYHAKERGRGDYYFFTETMLTAARERIDLEHQLRIALEERQFVLHYQPQMCARYDFICGVEALIRWQHPAQGMIPPDRFIPIAEETGIIHALGAWVLDEACGQLATWKAEGIRNIRVAINLSARQLQYEELPELVASVMAKHGIEGRELELEITETAAMSDAEFAVAQLSALRTLGVRLAIDDFGTGYSSLAYLKRLPIQILKLDRTFVRDIEHDKNDAEISAATLALAHNLGLKVVAEGVETVSQRDFLSELGCDYLQGYLFSKPLPEAEATRFIKERQMGERAAVNRIAH